MLLYAVIVCVCLYMNVECQDQQGFILASLGDHGDRITDLEGTVNALKAEYRGLLGEVSSLRQENTKLKAEIQTLTTQSNRSQCCCGDKQTEATQNPTTPVTTKTAATTQRIKTTGATTAKTTAINTHTATTPPTVPTSSTPAATTAYTFTTVATTRPTVSTPSTHAAKTGEPVRTTESGALTTTTTLTMTTSELSTAATTTSEKCEDNIDNCVAYGLSMCKSTTYRPWAKFHCSAFCQFCTPVTLTPFKCKDAIPNCAEFDAGDLCTTQSYFVWSLKNCFAYCGYPPCGTTNYAGSTVTKLTTTATTATNPPGTCADVRDDCLLYPDNECTGIYEAWAKAHCAFRCGFCNETLPCVDTKPDCDLYPSDICTNPTEAGWARQNCRKFCNMCTTILHESQTGHAATPGGAVTSKSPVKSTTLKTV